MRSEDQFPARRELKSLVVRVRAVRDLGERQVGVRPEPVGLGEAPDLVDRIPVRWVEFDQPPQLEERATRAFDELLADRRTLAVVRPADIHLETGQGPRAQQGDQVLVAAGGRGESPQLGQRVIAICAAPQRGVLHGIGPDRVLQPDLEDLGQSTAVCRPLFGVLGVGVESGENRGEVLPEITGLGLGFELDQQLRRVSRREQQRSSQPVEAATVVLRRDQRENPLQQHDALLDRLRAPEHLLEGVDGQIRPVCADIDIDEPVDRGRVSSVPVEDPLEGRSRCTVFAGLGPQPCDLQSQVYLTLFRLAEDPPLENRDLVPTVTASRVVLGQRAKRVAVVRRVVEHAAPRLDRPLRVVEVLVEILRRPPAERLRATRIAGERDLAEQRRIQRLEITPQAVEIHELLTRLGIRGVDRQQLAPGGLCPLVILDPLGVMTRDPAQDAQPGFRLLVEPIEAVEGPREALVVFYLLVQARERLARIDVVSLDVQAPLVELDRSRRVAEVDLCDGCRVCQKRAALTLVRGRLDALQERIDQLVVATGAAQPGAVTVEGERVVGHGVEHEAIDLRRLLHPTAVPERTGDQVLPLQNRVDGHGPTGVEVPEAFQCRPLGIRRVDPGELDRAERVVRPGIHDPLQDRAAGHRVGISGQLDLGQLAQEHRVRGPVRVLDLDLEERAQLLPTTRQTVQPRQLAGGLVCPVAEPPELLPCPDRERDIAQPLEGDHRARLRPGESIDGIPGGIDRRQVQIVDRAMVAELTVALRQEPDGFGVLRLLAGRGDERLFGERAVLETVAVDPREIEQHRRARTALRVGRVHDRVRRDRGQAPPTLRARQLLHLGAEEIELVGPRELPVGQTALDLGQRDRRRQGFQPERRLDAPSLLSAAGRRHEVGGHFDARLDVLRVLPLELLGDPLCSRDGISRVVGLLDAVAGEEPDLRGGRGRAFGRRGLRSLALFGRDFFGDRLIRRCRFLFRRCLFGRCLFGDRLLFCRDLGGYRHGLFVGYDPVGGLCDRSFGLIGRHFFGAGICCVGSRLGRRRDVFRLVAVFVVARERLARHLVQRDRFRGVGEVLPRRVGLPEEVVPWIVVCR